MPLAVAPRPPRPVPLAAAVVVLVLGCGTNGAGPDGGADRQPELPFVYRGCPLDQKVGGIKIALEQDFTSVGGSVTQTVIPADVREVVMESDGCRLLRKRNLQCLPRCMPGETCGEGGVCIPYPENVSAGIVTISGLAKAVRMAPGTTSRTYWDNTLPHPGFQPGASIRLETTGGDLKPLSLRGWGVSPLTLPEQSLRLETGQPFQLLWQQGPAGPARVQLTVSVDQHGTTPATLVCEGDDSGVLVVPEPLVTALLTAGASGYPAASLARQTVDAATVSGGCAEFAVVAETRPSLTVAGHLPCTTNADCPSGSTCATQLQTCQ